MNLVLQILFLVAIAVIFVRSATVLVKSVAGISAYFKMSEFSLSFILMAIITSIPELAVSISSALGGEPSLALGTAVGSNITDLTLIIAIPTLLVRGLKVQSIIARRDSFFMAVFAMVPAVMLLDKSISRIDAIILLVFYALYMYRLLTQRSHFSDRINSVGQRETIGQFFKMIGAIALLFASSYILVYTAGEIATGLGVPVLLIGLVLVPVSTTLPELVHGLRAVSLHHQDQVLGDVLGSVVANSTVVLAAAALIHPITIENSVPLLVTFGFLALVILIFLVGVYTDKELRVKEAIFLLFIYATYVFVELGLEIVNRSV